MRSTPVSLAVFLLCAVALIAHQDTKTAKQQKPKSGDTIVAKGCLRGTMLESTEIVLANDDPLPSGHTFQLKGKKDLLRSLREKHDGYLVEVTGVLKSDLMERSERGTRIGNTRIVVGAESSMRAGGPMLSEALPVLEAKSFEGFPTSCRR